MSQKGVKGKTNPELIALVTSLKNRGREEGAPIWRDIAQRLERPSRLWAEVNVGKLETTVGEGETAVVPGKVLSAGHVTRPIKVAAFRFSQKAEQKISAAGGSCMTLDQLAADNKTGKMCRIMG